MIETICICGTRERDPWGKKEETLLVHCRACGLGRVDAFDSVVYFRQYETGHYHNGDRSKRGLVPYVERFDHDAIIAGQRIVKIKKHKQNGLLFDVGCGNGAFVATAINNGYDACGCDPYLGTCTKSWIKSRLCEGEITAVPLLFRKRFDVITVHDVLEHCIDPKQMILFVRALLKDDGLLVIDVPDCECDEAKKMGMDFHHIKPSEHLWYFGERHLRALLEEKTWQIVEVDHPIPGKIVMYAKPQPAGIDLVLRVPPGIGDVHWCIMKAEALRAFHEPCRMKVEVSSMSSPEAKHRSLGFLDLVPFVENSSVEDFHFAQQLIATKSNPFFSMYPNPHLEAGNRIETWHPELATDYSYPLFAPASDKGWAQAIKQQAGGKLFVFSLASEVYYEDFTLGEWNVGKWVDVVEWVQKEHGIKPVIIGGSWDLSYAKEFLKQIGEENCIDLVGETSVASAFALFREAEVVCGPASGMTIMALHIGAKVVMGWPVREYKYRDVSFHTGIRTSWINDEQTSRYAPIGWDVCTPNAMRTAIEKFAS